MTTEVATRPRVTGHPVRWAVDLGVGGALMPLAFQLPLAVAFRTVEPWGEVLPYAFAIGGLSAVVGLGAPLALNGWRKGVPLWLLWILAGTVAAFVAWSAAPLVRMDPWLRVAFTLMAGSVGGVAWLPYVVATATRRPTWPIVVGAAAAWATAGLLQLTSSLHP